jgi:glycosyltransferase involved in cell wall biosynthesis
MSKKPKKENEDLIVAYVGKPVPQKGLNDIIKPACKIANCKLIINDRNYTNALGPDDMRLFYNKADVYLVASTIDGTPNPALEAAACGKPIISNPIGNMPEFITNWENGFLIKQDMEDKNMIIQKYVYCLKRLKENKQECFDMGMNARQEILNNWTWEKVTENERKIFREILNGI